MYKGPFYVRAYATQYYLQRNPIPRWKVTLANELIHNKRIHLLLQFLPPPESPLLQRLRDVRRKRHTKLRRNPRTLDYLLSRPTNRPRWSSLKAALLKLLVNHLLETNPLSQLPGTGPPAVDLDISEFQQCTKLSFLLRRCLGELVRFEILSFALHMNVGMQVLRLWFGCCAEVMI